MQRGNPTKKRVGRPAQKKKKRWINNKTVESSRNCVKLYLLKIKQNTCKCVNTHTHSQFKGICDSLANDSLDRNQRLNLKKNRIASIRTSFRVSVWGDPSISSNNIG